MRLIFYIFIFYYFYIPSQLTLEVINNLYISAASHPGGTKQGRGESSGKFASNISQRKILQRILPKLRRKFQCLTQGVFENGGAIKVYSNDMVFCDERDQYDVQQS